MAKKTSGPIIGIRRHGPWTIDHRQINITMLRETDLFFLHNDEPIRSCLLFLREFILGYDKNMTEAWKYSMPFYFYKDERICYLWVNKKTQQPYVGFVDGRKIEHPH